MISPHGPEHPFHKLSQNDRSAQDPNSSFIAGDFFEIPTNSKDEPMFKVTDWTRKLKYYNDPHKLKMMKLALSQMDKFWAIYESKAWKKVADNKLGAVVSTMDTDDTGGARSVRGDCWIPYSPKDLFFMITDMSEDRKIFDPMFNGCEIFEKYGQNTFSMWQLTNRIGIVAPRDFVCCCHGNIVSTFYFSA